MSPGILEIAALGALILLLPKLFRWFLTARSLRSYVTLPTNWQPIAVEQAPIYLRERAAFEAPRLEELGFEEDGPFLLTDNQIGPDPCWVWRHPEAGTLYTLSFVLGADPQHPSCGLHTWLEDGGLISTTNRSVPEGEQIEVPGVIAVDLSGADFETLWGRHLPLVQARVESTGQMPRQLERASAEAARAEQAARAWAALQGATDRYTPTAGGGLRLRWSWILRRGIAIAQRPPPAPVASTGPALEYSPEAQVELDVQLAHRLEAMRRARRLSPGGRLALSAITLALFAAVMAWRNNLQPALILTGALLFHELGHIVAMRLFGSRDTSLLFIPLLGGAAVQNDRPAVKPWQEVIILLAGPLPGLAIGFGLLGYSTMLLEPPPEWLWPTAAILLGLNIFNLLPILPLDGGQLLNVAFLVRFPRLGALFKLLSAFALGFLGWYSGTYLLTVIGLFALIRFPTEMRLAGAYLELRRAARHDGFQSSEEEPWLRRILHHFRRVPESSPQGLGRILEANRLVQILRQPLAGAGTMLFALIGWSAPIWIPLAGLPVLHHLSRQEYVRAQAGARRAGLADPADLASNLRRRQAPIAPADDARADYGAAVAGRGRGEAQAAGMVSPASWSALQRGASRKYWPQEAPSEGISRRLRQDGLDPRAVAGVLGRRLEQVMVADDAAAIAEVSQLARRVAGQIASSPRWDDDRALPEFWETWCAGLERALILRAAKGRPLSEANAAALAADLPPPAAFSERVHVTFTNRLAQLEDSWDLTLERIQVSTSSAQSSRVMQYVYQLLTPLRQREWAASLRDGTILWAHLAKGGDPWGRVPPPSREPAPAIARELWEVHRRGWLNASVRTDLARGALAWHATWLREGRPPAQLEAIRAPWFEAPAPDPVHARSWRLDHRAPNDQRFVFDPPAGAAAEEGLRWELTQLQRLEQ